MKETEKSIICTNADEVLKAINEHPKAILHLSKRQVRKMANDVIIAIQRQLTADLHYDGFYGFRINKDTGEVFVRPNYKYNTTELRKEIIEDVRKSLKAEVELLVIQEYKKELHDCMKQYLDRWTKKGIIEDMIVHNTQEAIRRSATNLIDFTLKKETKDE